MTTQFEFRLVGADAPTGELPADHLISLVDSLREVVSKIGRIETNAEAVGRSPRRTQRVAGLMIGLAPGSTILRMHRAGVPDSLDFESDEEQAFDTKFSELMQSLGKNVRPEWVGHSLSLAISHLAMALERTARSVEFSADGVVRSAFDTSALDRDLWDAMKVEGADEITFVGTLYAANLHSHKLRLEDGAGNRVALLSVANDAAVAPMIGNVVSAVGTPEYDSSGLLQAIRRASIAIAPAIVDESLMARDIPLDEILRSAPGPNTDDTIELTDDEFTRFLEAARA